MHNNKATGKPSSASIGREEQDESEGEESEGEAAGAPVEHGVGKEGVARSRYRMTVVI